MQCDGKVLSSVQEHVIRASAAIDHAHTDHRGAHATSYHQPYYTHSTTHAHIHPHPRSPHRGRSTYPHPPTRPPSPPNPPNHTKTHTHTHSPFVFQRAIGAALNHTSTHPPTHLHPPTHSPPPPTHTHLLCSKGRIEPLSIIFFTLYRRLATIIARTGTVGGRTR